MVTKATNSTATVQTSNPLNVLVTSAAGGAGQALAITTSTTFVTLYNTSQSAGVEYQLNAGPWTFIGKSTGAIVEADLAASTIKLRQTNDGIGNPTVEIGTDSAPSSKWGGIQNPLIIIGASGVAPTNADGRPDGTVYIY